jgi:hypothetical protein
VSGSLPTASQSLKATSVPPAFAQTNSLIRMTIRNFRVALAEKRETRFAL